MPKLRRSHDTSTRGNKVKRRAGEGRAEGSERTTGSWKNDEKGMKSRRRKQENEQEEKEREETLNGGIRLE